MWYSNKCINRFINVNSSCMRPTLAPWENRRLRLVYMPLCYQSRIYSSHRSCVVLATLNGWGSDSLHSTSALGINDKLRSWRNVHIIGRVFACPASHWWLSCKNSVSTVFSYFDDVDVTCAQELSSSVEEHLQPSPCYVVFLTRMR